MNELLEQYRRAEGPLRQVIDAVPADRWGSPSPCEDWNARDVVGHMIDAQRNHFTNHDLTLPDAPDVEADPATAWHEHVAAAEALIADGEAMAIGFDGHFGPTTVGEALQRFYVFDMVAHRWDIATATGQDATLTDDELDRLEQAIAGFGDAAYMPGVFRGGVEATDRATRQDRVLAAMGRTA